MDFDLSRQIGPLPLGVWLLAIGGGLGLSFLVNRNAGDDQGEAEPDASPLAGTGLVHAPREPIYLVDDSPTQAPSGPAPDTDADGAITDNYAWERAAITFHVGRGVDGVTAQDAIGRYLTGEPVTNAQRNLVSAAIRELGPPPQPVPPLRTADEASRDTPEQPIGEGSNDAAQKRAEQRVRDLFMRYGVTIPTPTESAQQRVARIAREVLNGSRSWADVEASIRRLAGLSNGGSSSGGSSSSKPKTKPSGGTSYTIKSGDTLWAIARRYYGNGADWPRIWQANKPMRSGNPDLIYPGERITIPPK